MSRRNPRRTVALLAAVLLGIAAVVFIRVLWSPPFKTPSAKLLLQAFPNSSQTIFETSDTFILLSLDPSWQWGKVLGGKGKDMFHDFRILGQVTLKDADTLREIRQAFYDGLVVEGMTPACFSPAHGIRAQKGLNTLDLLICFKCSQVQVFLNGQEKGYRKFSRRNREKFDRILRSQGVPLEP